MKNVRSEFGKCVDKNTYEVLDFILIINGSSKVYRVNGIKMLEKDFYKNYIEKDLLNQVNNHMNNLVD